MRNEDNYAPLCPTYRKRIMVITAIIAAVGSILFLMGLFGFLIACSEAKTTCNLTIVDSECDLNLLHSNTTDCETGCPDDFDNFEGDGWTEIKCYYDPKLMECPEVDCSGDLFPIIELVAAGLGLLVSSVCIYIINSSKCRVSGTN